MLGRYKVANDVRVTLHTAINSVASSIVVDAASGTFNNPADPSGDAPSNGVAIATIVDSLTTPTKKEIFTYTSLTNNGNGTYTLGGATRAREGTTAQSFSVGAFVMQAFTAGQLTHPYVTADQAAGTLALGAPTTITGAATQQDAATSGFRALLSAGALKFAKYSSGFKDRWGWLIAGTEAGSNAGSDLALASYTDAGASLNPNVLTVNRATGNVGVNQTPDATRRLAVGGDLFASNVVANGGYLGCYFSGLVGDFDAFKLTNTVVFGSLQAVTMSVSANGIGYTTAFSINPSTGVVTMPLATVTSLTFTSASGGTIALGTQPGTPPISGGNLAISGTNAAATASVMRFSADATPPVLALGKARGSIAAPAITADGDVFGKLAFYSATTSSAWKETGSIRFEADGTQSTGSSPSAIVFELTIVSNAAPQEIFRIDSLGQVTFAGFTSVTASSFIANSRCDFSAGFQTDSVDIRGTTVSQAAPTTSVNNATLASSTHIIRLTGTGGGTWTGLVAGGSGRVVTIFNTTTSAVSLAHNSASSTATNRFELPGSATFVIGANDAVTLWYDGTTTRWRVKR